MHVKYIAYTFKTGALEVKTNGFIFLFLTRELHACARASSRYDVENGTRPLARSLARSIGRSL